DISEPVEPSSDAAGVVELAVATDAAHERTFALIKPDAYPRYHKQIVKHIIERGLTVIAQEEVQLTAAVAGNIYNEMSAFPTFTRLVDFVTSGPALALVLEGANAIAVLRSLVGPTNPKSAKFEAPNSLRAKYGQDAQMNAVHASKDVREARRSIDAVFYGLLRGNFRVLQPTDDPLAAVSEPHQPASLELLADEPEPEPEPESESEAPAVEGAEHVAEGGDAAEEQPPISINTIVPADESHLVSQMETLAVAEEAVEEAMVEEPVEEPVDEEAEEELAEEAPAVEPAVEEPAEELVNQAAEEPEADVGFVTGASAEAAVTPDQL
ncbi:50S ribosomal protein L3, partial [Coemansia linderi]